MAEALPHFNPGDETTRGLFQRTLDQRIRYSEHKHDVIARTGLRDDLYRQVHILALYDFLVDVDTAVAKRTEEIFAFFVEQDPEVELTAAEVTNMAAAEIGVELMALNQAYQNEGPAGVSA